jgi:hypothetical protein
MENAEVEKEIKAKTRLDSIYMRFNDKLKRTRDEYRELAIRKVALNNLNAKEELNQTLQNLEQASLSVSLSVGNILNSYEIKKMIPLQYFYYV